MSFERPAKGALTFQCDGCYDPRDFLKADGDPVNNFRACWAILQDEGWHVVDGDHLCEDCYKKHREDRKSLGIRKFG